MSNAVAIEPRRKPRRKALLVLESVGTPQAVSRIAARMLAMLGTEPAPAPARAIPQLSDDDPADEDGGHWTLAPNQRWRIERLQTPPWADHAAMRAFYAEARRRTRETGVPHHVDHDIPLRGRLVSGLLHVHTNLQVLSGADNVRKQNRFPVGGNA